MHPQIKGELLGVIAVIVCSLGFCKEGMSNGVMAALQILVLSVQVRVLVGQLNGSVRDRFFLSRGSICMAVTKTKVNKLLPNRFFLVSL